jgi:Beta protein
VAESGAVLAVESYVPILKSKQGEFGALALMPSSSRARTVPLIELAVARVGSLASVWSDSVNTVMVQPLDVEGLDAPAWAAEVQRVLDELRSEWVRVIPTVTPDEANDVLAVVGGAAVTDGHGICIRLDAEDYALESPGSVDAELRRVLDLTGMNEADVDLVIDCGLVRNSVTARVVTAEGVLRVLPNLKRWRNVVVAFSAFPEKPGDVAQKGGVTPIVREERLSRELLK